MTAFGLTIDGADVEWFDTWQEAKEAHQKKSRRWYWSIFVYGFAQRLCIMSFHPGLGFYPIGYVDEDGVNLLEKFGVDKEIFGE